MTAKAQFSAEEWQLLREAPMLVSAGVGAADPSGIFGAFKEALAGVKGAVEAAREYPNVELIQALLKDQETPKQPDRDQLLGPGDSQQKLQHLQGAVLDRCTRAMALVKSKATAEEARAYRDWLMGTARKAAEAAKEGGFLGFGGQQVSSAEEAYLTQIEKALA
jgi:hypothetical protein